MSIALHGALIVLATVATKDDGTAAPPAPDRDTTYVFLPPAPTPRPIGSERGGTAGRAPVPGPVVPIPAAPVVVPDELPPVDPFAPVIDRTRTSLEESAGRELTNGRGGDGVGGTGYAGGPVAERGAAALPGNPRPRYPAALQAAGVEGRVLAEFVVDTSGAIVLETVRIIESDHALFEAAVREVLPRLRFVPAESGGRKVRQVVRQPFDFRLEMLIGESRHLDGSHVRSRISRNATGAGAARHPRGAAA